MKVAYSVLIVLISLAILNSYLAAIKKKPMDNYWVNVKQDQNALKTNIQILAKIGINDHAIAREMASIYRQNGEETQAEAIYTQLWKLDLAKKSLVYDPEYIADARNLAQIYEERSAFPNAFYYRKLILDYDRQCRPVNDTDTARDNRIARDLTNYAVTCHLAGMTFPDVKERNRYYEGAEKSYKEACAIYQRNPALKAHVAFNLLDQALVLRELGRSDESVQLTVQAESILKSLKS